MNEIRKKKERMRREKISTEKKRKEKRGKRKRKRNVLENANKWKTVNEHKSAVEGDIKKLRLFALLSRVSSPKGMNSLGRIFFSTMLNMSHIM